MAHPLLYVVLRNGTVLFRVFQAVAHLIEDIEMVLDVLKRDAQTSLATTATESDEVQTARLLKALETPRDTGSSYARVNNTQRRSGNNRPRLSGNGKGIGGQNPHPPAKNAGRVGHPGSTYAAGILTFVL